MGRTAQGATFDAILAGDGFDSRWLLEITLADTSVLYLSDAPITWNGHVYQVEIEEPPEIVFSQGLLSDGARWPMALQNADGAYSTTDTSGVSPLEGAEFVLRYAVAYPGESSWQVDFICDGKLREVLPDQAQAKFTLIHRMYDKQHLMSSESVTLEELSPIAGSVGDLIGGIIGNVGGGSRGRLINGWRLDPYLMIEDDERFTRDWRQGLNG